MTGCSIAENKSSNELVRSLTCWYTENLTDVSVKCAKTRSVMANDTEIYDVETLRGGV